MLITTNQLEHQPFRPTVLLSSAVGFGFGLSAAFFTAALGFCRTSAKRPVSLLSACPRAGLSACLFVCSGARARWSSPSDVYRPARQISTSYSIPQEQIFFQAFQTTFVIFSFFISFFVV